MECGKCDEIKRINEDVCRCGILNREVSPFWGLIDRALRCPLGKDEAERKLAESIKA